MALGGPVSLTFKRYFRLQAAILPVILFAAAISAMRAQTPSPTQAAAPVTTPAADATTTAAQPNVDSATALREAFVAPPDDSRIMVRWWWFGPSVTKDELDRELHAMKAGGIGGVETQPVYPLALDDPVTGFHNFPYMSDEFLGDLRFASDKARELGMRFDLTLGSGWPFGGPNIPITEAAGMLRVVAVPVSVGDPELNPGAPSVEVPDIGTGEKLLAVFLVDGENPPSSATGGNKPSLEGAEMLAPATMNDGRVFLPADTTDSHDVLFFIASRTGMQVKRPAVGAEGFVLDHYDRNAIETHLHTVGDKLLAALGPNPPYAVFSDSLEVYESNWTGDFLEQFQKRRGYDLTPYLPALVGDIGPNTDAVRHDWGKTLTELANDNYLTPFREWADAHGTKFRSQNYGTPPVTLSSNELVDLAEGEGYNWNGFSAVRWASSANHLYGRTVTSSETWTWLHSPVFRARPIDMKAGADLYFLEGSNQLIGHGWPYSPPSAGEPGWRFYAAAVFDDHNPWYAVMPDVTRYLQRVSFLLRQGKPMNDVALLLPTDDAWSKFNALVGGPEMPPHVYFSPILTHVPNGGAPGAAGPNFPRVAPAAPPLGTSISVNQTMVPLLGNKVIPQILGAGFNLDFIDADAIDKVGIPYRVLILPGITRLPLATYRKIEAFAKAGGIVIATRSLPSLAPGMQEAATDTPEIAALSEILFHASGAAGHFVADESDLGKTLAQLTRPDMALSHESPEVGFVHRKLEYGDLYFVANTSNHLVDTQATFRVASEQAEIWDPISGTRTAVDATHSAPGGAATSTVDLTLAPYQSLVVVFMNDKEREATAKDRTTYRVKKGIGKQTEMPAPVDLGTNWSVTYTGLGAASGSSITMDQLHSWTDDAETKYYSGQAVYEKTVSVPAAMIKPGIKVIIDFGPGTVIEKPVARATVGDGTGSGGLRLQAWIESPVREAAQVFVNGNAAGDVWLPPYEVDVTRLVHAGDNKIKVVVANLAINEMAGKALPDYRLLNLKYGERFEAQDLSGLMPLPSGILGDPKLVARPAE
ncbi:MAG: glycosyl hydrolase [Candidatus Acidiferrales bacterium]